MKKALSLLFATIFFSQLFAATVSTSKATYTVGEPIVVNFSGSTAAKDWIGIYNPPTTPTGYSINWLYCNSGARTSGAAAKATGSITFTDKLTAGTYSVYMCANDGSTVMAQTEFKVISPASAAFSASTNYINEGASISFSDLSSNNPTAWSWTFPGGTPATSTEQNPTITYATQGNYDVSLTATGPEGNAELTKQNFISVVKSYSDTHLNVLQFNIWQEGTSVTNGMTYIRDVIDTVNPDIVCFSEVRNYSGDWTDKIVADLAALGKTYYAGYVQNTDVSIISKFPINAAESIVSLSSDRGSMVAFDVNVNGTPIVVCTAHLDYTFYATYLPRAYACGGSGKYAGWNALSPFVPETSLEAIAAQNLASQRDEQIAAFINYTENEARPVLLLGDFNEPSCLDWTERQANLYDHNGVVYEWNSTLALKNAGFTDAYRQVYPDEVLNPGITWPAVATNGGKSTSWTPLSDERDRIDYIFYKGVGLTAVDAAMVGPKGNYVKNVSSEEGNGADVFEASDMSWPSDHKAVRATILIPARTSTAVGTPVFNSGLGIRVFPNPTDGSFNVISNENLAAKIEITNTGGKSLLNKTETLFAGKSNPLDISAFPKGVYLLSIASGQKLQTIKLVRE